MIRRTLGWLALAVIFVAVLLHLADLEDWAQFAAEVAFFSLAGAVVSWRLK